MNLTKEEKQRERIFVELEKAWIEYLNTEDYESFLDRTVDYIISK